MWFFYKCYTQCYCDCAQHFKWLFRCIFGFHIQIATALFCLYFGHIKICALRWSCDRLMFEDICKPQLWLLSVVRLCNDTSPSKNFAPSVNELVKTCIFTRHSTRTQVFTFVCTRIYVSRYVCMYISRYINLDVSTIWYFCEECKNVIILSVKYIVNMHKTQANQVKLKTTTK